MRAVEAPVRPAGRRARQLVDEREEPEPGRDPEVARVQAHRVHELLRHRMAPEEGDDEGGPTVAAGGRVARRARGEEHLRDVGPAHVRRLVQGGPPVDVAGAGVGAGLEEEADGARVAGRRGDAEQVVAVGALEGDEPWCRPQEVRQGVRVAVLDRPVGPHEGIVRVGRRARRGLHCGPAREAVEAGDDAPRALRGERRVPALERGERRRRAVAGRGQEAVGAVREVGDVVAEGVPAAGVGWGRRRHGG